MIPGADKKLSDVFSIYVITLGGVLLLWYTPLAYAIRLFATLTHELGHVLATVLTGGQFLRIRVTAHASGWVQRDGGANWLISPAGYIMTAVTGALLLFCCSTVALQRRGLIVVAIALAAYTGVAAASIHVLVALGALLAWIIVLLVMDWEFLRGVTIRILAISLCLHSIFDLLALLFGYADRRTFPLWSSPVPEPKIDGFYTDATLMAWRYGGSEGLWATIWLAIGVAVLIIGTIAAARAEVADQFETRQVDIPTRLRAFKKCEGEYTLQ